MPVVGFLGSTTPRVYKENFVDVIQAGMADGGYHEGRNVAFEYRWANHQPEQLPQLALDLVRRQVAVIVTTGGNVPVHAAKAATSTIPIVFATGADPIESGLVKALSGSGTNVTGVTFYQNALWPKRIELVREALPGVTVFAMLMQAETAAQGTKENIESAAVAAGIKLLTIVTAAQADFISAFKEIADKRAEVILVDNHAHIHSRRDEIIALAISQRLPTMFYNIRGVREGGLLSYGPQLESVSEILRQAGLYVARILRGENPAVLPIQQPTRFELAVNLKTAKALGVTIAPTVLARANEVIE